MIAKSPHSDIAIPDTPLTPYVLRHAERLAEKPALIDGPTGRTVTYGQLAEGVRATAAGLARRGFKKGDVFAIYSPNLPEYAVAFHGVASAGGVNTTINPLYTAAELATQLRDSKAKFLLTIPQFLDKAMEATAKTDVQEVFVLGEADRGTPFAELAAADGTALEVGINPAEDLVALPYSSGTTGLPKGVMLTHRNLVANTVQELPCSLIDESDRVIAILPFYHIYAMEVVLNIALAHGATVVTMPRFDLEPFLRLLQDHEITVAPLVPPILLALARHPLVDDFDLSKLELVVSGAAPLSAELAEECANRLDCRICQGYGLTETSPVTHFSPKHTDEPRWDSAGLPFPNTECKAVDIETGETLGPGEDGEICIRGPQVMKGYLRDPEATAAAIDAEGWFHTGDLGHSDEEGYLYVVDRLKEMIKYKAMQVAPAELEAVLIGHPAVSDAAVIPSPDEEAGEVPKAFVVAKGEVDAGEIMAYVAGRVAPHKKVRLLEFVDEIPKSASGKILRRVLVEQERERVRGAGVELDR